MNVSQIKADYDVVIAGGGLVGGSFALLLTAMTQRGLRVLVLDAAEPLSEDPDTRPADFDARSTALSWGSRQIYEAAGLWPALAPQATAIRDIHVSDRGHFGATRLCSEDMAVDALGYVLENRDLGRALQQALKTHEGLDFFAPANVQHIKPIPEGVVLQVSTSSAGDPLTVRASLLVLADGGRSGLCEQLGIVLRHQPYGQQALICNIAFEKNHQGLAFERFTDTGPLAVLPLADHGQTHRGALVWTLPEQDAHQVLALPDAEFIAALEQRFGRRLGRITRSGARSLFPLSLVLAQEQIRPGIVLLGNVAHTLHPVAGQGLNLALRDARALSELIAQTVINDGVGKNGVGKNGVGKIGEFGVLQKFLDAQKADQQRTIAFSDLTTRLFSNSNPLLAVGRNLGLLTMDLLPPAKHWFARQAMGMADRITT